MGDKKMSTTKPNRSTHEIYGNGESPASKSGKAFYGKGGTLDRERERVKAINNRLSGGKTASESFEEYRKAKLDSLKGNFNNGNEKVVNMLAKPFSGGRVGPKEVFPATGPLTEVQTNMQWRPSLYYNNFPVTLDEYKARPKSYLGAKLGWINQYGRIAVDDRGKLIPSAVPDPTRPGKMKLLDSYGYPLNVQRKPPTPKAPKVSTKANMIFNAVPAVNSMIDNYDEMQRISPAEAYRNAGNFASDDDFMAEYGDAALYAPQTNGFRIPDVFAPFDVMKYMNYNPYEA